MTRQAQPNWFPTLNAALEAEGLLEAWDCTFPPIPYGGTHAFTWYDGSNNGRWVSIYRETNGKYERPVHYAR